jgi:hypothetical protein
MTQFLLFLRHLLFTFLILCFHSNLGAQSLQEQIKPNLSFQYSSSGTVRLEIFDAIEGQYKLTCSYAAKRDNFEQISLTESEDTHLKSILQSLKAESYSLSLPDHGVVITLDGEPIEIELDAVSCHLLYRDDYKRAKSHKPIRLLVGWIKRKFPKISTQK